MSETLKAHERRVKDGFYKYLEGAEKILDVGYAGTGGETFPGYNVTGLDIDTPGYDGRNIPFPDESFDVVYSSHFLEHIIDINHALIEQWRVLKRFGHLIIYVPHQYLYEKQIKLIRTGEPFTSKFNLQHRRCFLPAHLLTELEYALPLGSYRIRRCQDCDYGYNYGLPAEVHPVGEFSIEVILQKL